MTKNKHLSFDEWLEIEKGLKKNKSFKEIATIISKDCTTISKEIRNHLVFKNSGAIGKPFLDCKFRNDCPFRIKGTLCNSKNCTHYEKENCSKLNKAPYVCNGCKNKTKCTLSKKFYESEKAYHEYLDNLKESRTGITYSELEIENLNDILVPLIKEKGQSVHHAYINNTNKIICCEKKFIG